MLSSRLKAFVMPTSQTSATAVASRPITDQLHTQAGRYGDARRGELCAELRDRAQVT